MKESNKNRKRHLAAVLFFTFPALLLHASEAPKSVFVRAQCDGKLSAGILASFREAINTSQKYRLVSSMDDDGRFGMVLAIYMVCAERSDFAAVATTYGQGKCLASTDCHQMIEGISLKLALCESNAAVECGRQLFKTFDGYVSGQPGIRKSQ